MKKWISILMVASLFLANCGTADESAEEQKTTEWSVVVHGGASNTKNRPSDERIARYEKHLLEAIDIGAEILANGGTALDAVQAVTIYMEDCPIFNAGRGAVMTLEGTHELDASIMDGSNLKAGAVAGLKTIKNPIKAARLVMDSTTHLFLIGEGATFFSEEMGLETVENSYFTTEQRLNQHKRVLKRLEKEDPRGTVGCVAKDKYGNLAAATSTGGMSGKKWGRVGDVPVVGSGVYANNETVAISSTGHGECWMRRVVAFDVSALMDYRGMSLKDAAYEVIQNKVDNTEDCSGGGIIAVDKYGNIVAEHNTNRMYRAWANSDGVRSTGVMKGEDRLVPKE